MVSLDTQEELSSDGKSRTYRRGSLVMVSLDIQEGLSSDGKSRHTGGAPLVNGKSRHTGVAL